MTHELEARVRSNRHKVLLVDDVIENIQLLSGMLETEYEYFFAINGEHAVKLAQEHKPDLILLDVVMPGMNGYEVMTALRQDVTTEDIRVILVTAHHGDAAETAALDAGAVDFITKPVNPSVLRARVRTHTRLARRTQELQQLGTQYKTMAEQYQQLTSKYEAMAEQFHHLSIHDELTGLYNRHYLDSLLFKETARAMRAQQPMSLALLDLDRFKSVNDNDGQAAGDAVLAGVAGVIQARLRDMDTAFRYGGEEFLLVLPNTDHDSAYTLCDELRQLVADSQIANLAQGAVTMSVGIAQYHPGESPLKDTVSRADLAMYQAKDAGRNTVVIDRLNVAASGASA